MTDIIDHLRKSSAGYKEWRVQNPADGAFCMSFSRRNSINPERDAREWLEDHQRAFPDSRFSQYVVGCVDMLTAGDKLAIEAADRIDALTAEIVRLKKDSEIDSDTITACGHKLLELDRLVAENARLRDELADALDCKAGDRPTALSWAIAERDRLREELERARVAFGEIEWSNNSTWQSSRAKAFLAAIDAARKLGC